MDIIKLIATQLQLNPQHVAAVIRLYEVDGATIPFISRYRKEATADMGETLIESTINLLTKYRTLQKRKETIVATITQQGAMSDELRKRIDDCCDAALLEDIYLPYKPKHNTKAAAARAKGLEPLALVLLAQKRGTLDLAIKASLNDKVKSHEEALMGAKDIVAEIISTDERARASARREFGGYSQITAKVVKGKESEGDKYRDYFDFSTSLNRCSSHRILALLRGEKDGFLKIKLEVDDERIIERIKRDKVYGQSECRIHLEEAIEDGYKRLLRPSIANETMALAKEQADNQAIAIFAKNLRQLLLAAPLGGKRTLAIDPGFRTGCKVVCLDANGNLLHNETIYPHPPVGKWSEAQTKISQLVEAYKIEAIAIGDKTAGRESEEFIKSIRFSRDITVFSVSEDGASVYSASKIAREEFPSYDVTVRGAISIGRRLMDPLSELVKIEPRSIGVGQYQHDVDQSNLKSSLDQVVESCVNRVGVNLNTASKHLMTYVSGISAKIAESIVEFRQANGNFSSRKQLLSVAGLGAKRYEQCAGFLRITNADNPLDGSAVHPESYHIVEKMAKDSGCTVAQLMASKEQRDKIDLSKYMSEKVGMPTLKDIIEELDKPGLDPRQSVKVLSFDQNIKKIEDLSSGMVLNGIVTNLTAFGAFVNIGIKEQGLVHISHIANRFIKDPAEAIALGEHVKVKVLEVDMARKRIALSIKEAID